MTTETAISSTPRSTAPPAIRPGARAVIAMVTAAMFADAAGIAVPCLLGFVLLGADESRIPHRLDPQPN